MSPFLPPKAHSCSEHRHRIAVFVTAIPGSTFPGILPNIYFGEKAVIGIGSKSITRNGRFPEGTIPDPIRPDSVLVPFGDGYAVYEVHKNGTAALETVIHTSKGL